MDGVNNDGAGNTGGSLGLGLSASDEELLEETIGIMFGLDIVFPEDDDDNSLDDGESV